ncbi:MAG: nicotinamide-nucleotide amidase [Actinomycetota bacterium]|nr:nicotinamide-nucleotide amidase [Actinomycetota bacterium]
MSSLAQDVIAGLTGRGLTIAVAESLTGGLLVAELVSVPGASAVLNGGVVAYNTALKHSLLGVDARLLAEHGAVHPDVAGQMASGVRSACAVEGVPAAIGISTTGVAGPDPQDGQPVGTVFVGISSDAGTSVLSLRLEGTRQAIREAVVFESLAQLKIILAAPAN